MNCEERGHSGRGRGGARRNRERQALVRLTLFGVGSTLLAAILNCGRKPEEGRLERQIRQASVQPAQQLSRASAAVAVSRPLPAEVRQAIVRIYGDAVRVEGGASPCYIVGDFNGDGSQDLAVEVRPAPGGVGKLNDEVANWILEDPGQIFVPDPSQRVQRFPPPPRRPHIEAGEALLAIVHGHGAGGWRETSARQSYLLRNMVTNGMVKETKEDALARERSGRPMPRLFGDVIRGKGGHSGFLFWTGGHYAWQPGEAVQALDPRQ